MKEIKIILANVRKIEEALREINLKSTAHTYTRFAQIEAHLWRDLWATETKTESITNG